MNGERWLSAEHQRTGERDFKRPEFPRPTGCQGDLRNVGEEAHAGAVS